MQINKFQIKSPNNIFEALIMIQFPLSIVVYPSTMKESLKALFIPEFSVDDYLKLSAPSKVV